MRSLCFNSCRLYRKLSDNTMMARAAPTMKISTISGPIVSFSPCIETRGHGAIVSPGMKHFGPRNGSKTNHGVSVIQHGMEQEIRACLDQKRYEEAFDLLLPEFQNKVFRLAYAMLGDAARAEDLAQDVFLRAWKALPGFRGQSSVSTWIYAITRNACLTALKAAGAKEERSLEERGIAHAAERAAR